MRRVKKAILGLMALAAVYLAAAVVLSIRAGKQNEAFRAQLDRLDELGTKTAAGLDAAPSESLAQSCKALPEVKSIEVAAYFTKTAIDVGDLGFVPQRAIQASAEQIDFPWHQRDTGYFLYELMSDLPPYWPMYLERWSDPFHHDLSATKYLVVHVLTGATRPRVLNEREYEAGELTFNSAVVDVPTGEVLCAGNSVVTDTRDVKVTGRGETSFDAKEDAARKRDQELLTDLGFAARTFGLGEVCWIGGKSLCDSTFKKFDRPE